MLPPRLGKVLVVDDDPLLLSRIERVLSRADLEVRCALGGDEALQLVRSESFAVAIVDYHLVRMDGRVVLEELRRLQPQCGRLLLSGCLDLAVVMEVVNTCQIHRVMQKPFDKEVLLGAVRELMKEQTVDDKTTLTVLRQGTIVGDYEIESCIGQGGMSTVYGAVHRVIGRKAALKVMNLPASPNSPAVERFVEEAKVVNQLRQETNVDIFAYGTLPDGRPYLVMEWLEGETMRTRMERSAISLHEIFAICEQLCSALEPIHGAGFVHRDIKPENIMLLEGDELRIKLLDFGLAKFVGGEAPRYTLPGTFVGTPHYLSPEQAGGSQEISSASDVYAFGVVLYELLTQRYPFDGATLQEILFGHMVQSPEPPSSHRPGVPEALDDLVVRMLSKKPAERPSIAELRARLSAIRLERPQLVAIHSI